ncbi:adenylate cyclase [Pelomyxa schiedti]|nr:adenylate cyclase [Pelomyxa schiedti]
MTTTNAVAANNKGNIDVNEDSAETQRGLTTSSTGECSATATTVTSVMSCGGEHVRECHLSGIGVPMASFKRNQTNMCSLMLFVPVAAVVVILAIVGCCLAPMGALWARTLDSLTTTCISSLTHEIGVYRSLLVYQSVNAVTEQVMIPPSVADIVSHSIPESAYTSPVPLCNDSTAFQLVFRAVVSLFPVNNVVAAWVNSKGEHFYADRADLFWGYYDGNISSNLTLFLSDGTEFNMQRGMTITNYNLTGRDWWNLGLAAWNGSWTAVYMSANVRDGRVIAYTLRPPMAVPVVLQVALTLNWLQGFFINFNLTTNGLAFLTEDKSLQILAGTIGVPISIGGDIYAPNCSLPAIREVTAEWLNTSAFCESHSTMTIDGSIVYTDIVPIRAKGGLVLWLFLVTPEDDFLEKINEEQRRANNHSHTAVWVVLSIELFVGAIAVGISVALSLALVRSLSKVVKKLQSVSRGQIAKSGSSTLLQKSVLKEVDSLNSEVMKMQSALDSFSQYVPSEVVRYLCKNNLKAVVGVSKMHCTVMFLDVAEFTRHMEQQGAQIMIEMLSTMFESFSTIITENNGCIDKYIGGTIMALWGCPVIDHNSEVHACQAVSGILASLSKLNMIFRAKSYPTMRIRIGVNSGEVQAGNVGSTHRLNYTVLGNTVNLASRLEHLNKELGTSVLVTNSVRDAAKGSNTFSWRALGHIQVRGVNEPVLVHEFFGLSALMTQGTRNLLSAYQPIDTLLYTGDITNNGNSNNKTGNNSTTEQAKMDKDGRRMRMISEAISHYLDNNPDDHVIAQASLFMFDDKNHQHH